MSYVYLVRHGEIENPQGTLYGNLPGYHLSEEGRMQILKIADWFGINVSNVCKLIASPLERAQETAGIIADKLDVRIAIDPRLTEWGMGEWLGKPIEDFYHRSGYYSPAFKTDGMESLDKMADRMLEALQDAIEDCHDSSFVICSHREPMAALLIKLQQLAWPEIHQIDMPKGSVWELEFEDGEFRQAQRVV